MSFSRVWRTIYRRLSPAKGHTVKVSLKRQADRIHQPGLLQEVHIEIQRTRKGLQEENLVQEKLQWGQASELRAPSRGQGKTPMPEVIRQSRDQCNKWRPQGFCPYSTVLNVEQAPKKKRPWSDKVITFSEKNQCEITGSHDDPVVLNLKRVLFDTGSSADIHYLSAFKRMRLKNDALHRIISHFINFMRDTLQPRGMVQLKITFGTPPERWKWWWTSSSLMHHPLTTPSLAEVPWIK